MVRYGAHAFVWIGDWTPEAGDATIREAAATGFDFLEIPLLRPDLFDATRHRRTLEEVGLEAVCSLALPRAAHLPDNPEGAKRFLLGVLDKLEELGCTYLAGCIGYALGALTGAPPTEQERAQVIDTLGEVAEAAQRRGITLALEACNRYETHLYNTLRDTRETVLAIGAPNLKLHADTYHMNIEEEGFYTPLVESADVLDYMHMSESHRGLVGSGTVNWPEVFRGLKDARFAGALVLESFAAINPDIAAATCLWRPPKHPPEVLATQGLAFLKAGAAAVGL
jgi:D-psicose/D-tagatose/L-ribulose 3-epimerase